MGSASYPPVSLDTSRATLTFHAAETVTGVHSGSGTVPAADWAFADCRSKPFPGVPDPARVCLKSGFDPARLYELVYTAKDPLVLASASRRRAISSRSSVRSHRPGRHAEPGQCDQPFGGKRHVPGRELPEDVHPSRLQRGSRRADRGTGSFRSSRGARHRSTSGSPPRAAQPRSTSRAASPWWRGIGTRSGPRIGEFARSLLGFEDLSEGFRGIRCDGVLGLADVAGARRHRRRTRHPARQRQALLHAGHDARRRRGGFDVTQAANDRCVLPQNPNPMAETTRG